MLTFENVTKKYGDFTAVSNIQLELTEGIYGFLSPNGAGKTTILKMAAKLASWALKRLRSGRRIMV